MTQFGDDLRTLLAKKKDQLSARDAIAERARAADARRRDDLEAAAEGIARDVFGPLMNEFASVLVAAGVFLRSDASVAARHVSGAHICTVAARGGDGALYSIRFYAAATAEGRIALAGECGRRGAGAAKPGSENRGGETPPPPTAGLSSWQQFFDTADTPRSKDFSDEVIGRALQGGNTVPLVKIAGKSVAPEHAKNPSVELWCREALKRIAAACLQAHHERR